MPPVQLPVEEEGRPSAFTVLERDGGRREAGAEGEARRVLAVKPQRRVPAPPEPSSPHCMLDPKFSRALDFRLRRLQEKETLRANLSRPTRARQRRAMAASEPVLARAAAAPNLGGSQPRLFAPEAALGASPSPGRRSRVRAGYDPSESDKPRFVTTVKTGQFLLPPPEIACLLGLETLYPPQEREKIVYSYASRPKAVTTQAKRVPPERQDGPAAEGAARARVASVFGGVRALVAGVVGMRSLHGYVMSCLRAMQAAPTAPPCLIEISNTIRVLRSSGLLHVENESQRFGPLTNSIGHAVSWLLNFEVNVRMGSRLLVPVGLFDFMIVPRLVDIVYFIE